MTLAQRQPPMVSLSLFMTYIGDGGGSVGGEGAVEERQVDAVVARSRGVDHTSSCLRVQRR